MSRTRRRTVGSWAQTMTTCVVERYGQLQAHASSIGAVTVVVPSHVTRSTLYAQRTWPQVRTGAATPISGHTHSKARRRTKRHILPLYVSQHFEVLSGARSWQQAYARGSPLRATQPRDPKSPSPEHDMSILVYLPCAGLPGSNHRPAPIENCSKRRLTNGSLVLQSHGARRLFGKGKIGARPSLESLHKLRLRLSCGRDNTHMWGILAKKTRSSSCHWLPSQTRGRRERRATTTQRDFLTKTRGTVHELIIKPGRVTGLHACDVCGRRSRARAAGGSGSRSRSRSTHAGPEGSESPKDPRPRRAGQVPNKQACAPRDYVA